MTVSSRTTASVAVEETEVSARAGHRRFTVEDMTRMVEETAQCRARRTGDWHSPKTIGAAVGPADRRVSREYVTATLHAQ